MTSVKYVYLQESFKLTVFLSSIVCLIVFSNEYYEFKANQFDLIQVYDESHANKCKLYSSKLMGVYDVDVHHIPNEQELEFLLENVEKGGVYKPKKCESRQKLALIVPYRDRKDNLLLFLKYIHPFLQRQDQEYRVFVVEQNGNDVFNKGRIMNIGITEAIKIDNFDCFIFHDVDLIPENDRNIYDCYTHPRHLTPAVDELRYNLMYNILAGGALALNREQLRETNGYSNLYWGWGAEDDDMSMRILDSGFKITRPTSKTGRYKMMLHKKRSRAVNRFDLLTYWTRYTQEGLNSLTNLTYQIVSVEMSKFYTHVLIDVGPSKRDEIKTWQESKIAKAKFHFN